MWWRPQRRQAQDGMHPAWRQFETADGVPYFHNAVLGRSTWEKPPALFSRQVRACAADPHMKLLLQTMPPGTMLRPHHRHACAAKSCTPDSVRARFQSRVAASAPYLRHLWLDHNLPSCGDGLPRVHDLCRTDSAQASPIR